MLKLDHVVLAAETLEEGVDYVQDRLGVSLDAGGQHDLFGTHNRLLGLGDCYFEVIARNPLAKPAQRPLWFDL
ncbi:MAG: VOC family protein, partial [Paracoccaceae bacterium]